MHPITDRWEYNFAPTSALPAHRKCPGRIAERILVEGGYWAPALATVLDRLLSAM